VLHSADRGLTWTVTDTPIPAGDPARGLFALAFRDRTHGIAVGGDHRPDQQSPRSAATTRDGGRTCRTVDTGSYDTVDCAPDRSCWAAGEQGRVVRLEH
jgi:hypothetical protein